MALRLITAWTCSRYRTSVSVPEQDVVSMERNKDLPDGMALRIEVRKE